SFAHQNRTFNPTIDTVSNFVFATTQPGDWQVTITTGGGAGIRTLTGSGGSATAVWEGRDDNGVLQADGTYTYAVESTAATGERVIAHGRVVIDSNRTLTLSGVAAAPTFFSPNGDAVQESTTLTATANYDTASWAVAVRNSGGSVVRTLFGSGAAISYAWDGRTGSGSVQPDGVYALEVEATAGTATTSASASATLDATYPTLAITSPTSGGTLSNVRQGGTADASITGTAADANLTSWTLEWGSGSNPATWTVLRTSTTSVTSGELFVWPTLARTNGAYSLRLRATDMAGNAGAVAQPLTIGNFSASHVVLEFNGAAGATVSYTSVVPFAVTEALRIKKEAGQVVRTVVNGSRAAGTYSDVWNGRNDAGTLLPDGAYFYVAEVTEGQNTMVWDLTTQYRNDYIKADDDLNLGAFDPFNNQPLTFTYSFPQPGRISVGFAPTVAVDGTCDPPQFCLFHQQYQESGPHTVSWAGVDPDGVFRSEVRGIGVINNRELFSKNAVVLYGTKASVTSVRVTPPVFGPAVGTQTVTFQLGTYQNQPAAVTVSFLNQESRSVLRTLTLASQAPGAVSVVWDGRADNGMLVAPGAYTVTVTASDALGNRASGQILTTLQY
ncbi:MAG: FlgD immunoglobulin-like domain containing protein, partial [Thermoanaerobaculia bacterium]